MSAYSALIRLASFSFRFFPASGPTCVLWRAAIGRQQQPSVGPRRRATISSCAVRLCFGRSLRVRPLRWAGGGAFIFQPGASLCLLFSFAVVTPRHARHTGCDTGDLDDWIRRQSGSGGSDGDLAFVVVRFRFAATGPRCLSRFFGQPAAHGLYRHLADRGCNLWLHVKLGCLCMDPVIPHVTSAHSTGAIVSTRAVIWHAAWRFGANS